MEDVDFFNNTIHIYKQITSGNGTDKWEIKYKTKNKHERYTIIPPNIIALLYDYKLTNNFSDDQFLFFGDSPISANAINTKRRQHCMIAGVKCIRNHDFRHSYITYLLDNGTDFKIVAEQVGHENLSTTMNIYNHTTKKREQKLRSVLDNFIV